MEFTKDEIEFMKWAVQNVFVAGIKGNLGEVSNACAMAHSILSKLTPPPEKQNGTPESVPNREKIDNW